MARFSRWHHRRRPQDGFTLIELAVVMLIIAILVVVSLAFFGLIGTAHTSVATQDLKGAEAAAQTLWAQNNWCGAFNPSYGSSSLGAVNYKYLGGSGIAGETGWSQTPYTH